VKGLQKDDKTKPAPVKPRPLAKTK